MLSSVLLRLSKGFLIAALTLSLGAHWAFLQSVAWAGMLYSYSQQAGFGQAVSMTFDGDHPCSLCKTIQKGKAQEKDEEQRTVQPFKDLKLNLAPDDFLLCAPVVERPDAVCAPIFTQVSTPPDAPPPRLAAA